MRVIKASELREGESLSKNSYFQGGNNTETEGKPKKGIGSTVKKLAPFVFAGAMLFFAGWLTGGGSFNFKNLGATQANSSLPARLDYSSVDTIYTSLKNNFDGTLSEAELLKGLKAGLAKATGDPYTEYFDASEAKEFYEQLDGSFEGIGAELGKDEAGNIVIIAPLKGYPAEKADLRPKDIIAKIDDTPTTDFSVNDAVKRIRGAAGTEVRLTIVRDGVPFEVKIVREAITIPSVKSEVKDGIGVLTISRFGDDTAGLARSAAEDFMNQKVKGIILDLRGDPGGLLEAAVDVSSLWLKDKTILTERRDGKVVDTFRSRGTPTLLGVPTVVLIDAGSASASEITAGALRDNNAATLIGVKSYGKGSVQQPIDLKDGSLLKITVARWFTPGGKNIDKEGISPDQEVKLSDEDIKAARDPQLDAAFAKLKN